MGLFSFIGDFFETVVGWFINVPDVDENKQRGFEVKKEGTNHYVPVVYGTRRLAPITVHKETTADTKLLWVVGVLCEGPVAGAGLTSSDIWIDDVKLSDNRFAANYSIYHDRQLKYGTGTGDVIIYVMTGSPTLYNENLAGESSNWSSTDTLNGFCYVVMRFQYNPDLFRGEPDVKIAVKGKLCYDPRTGVTEWTDNPVLHLYDYLTNSRYGKGLSRSQLNSSTFKKAASKCDSLKASYLGGSNQRVFRGNMIVDTEKKLLDNVKSLMASFRGLYSFTDGKYSVVVEDDDPPVMTLTRNELIGNSLMYKGEDKSQRYNRVIAKYVDLGENWQVNETVWPGAGSKEEEQLLIEDNNETLEFILDLTQSCTNKYQARELARITCLTSRRDMTVQGTFTSEALVLTPGDVVNLDMEDGTIFGNSYPSSTFDSTFSADIYNGNSPGEYSLAQLVPYRVLKTTINDRGEVQLLLREHQPTIYPWLSDAEIPEYGLAPLPDPYEGVGTVVGLSLVEELELSANGDVVSFIDVSWTDFASDFVDLYEIRWRKSGSTNNYQYMQSRTNSAKVQGVRVGTTYEVQVRGIIESLNIRGLWSTAQTVLVDGDNGAPEAPSAISTNSGVYTVTINWTNPSDADLDVVEIHVRETNITPSDDTYLEDTVKAVPNKSQSYTISMRNRVIGDTYYIFLKAVDKSLNESSFSSSVTGIFNLATVDDLDADEQLFSVNALEKQAEKVLGANGDSASPFYGMHVGNSGTRLYLSSAYVMFNIISQYDFGTAYSAPTLSLVSNKQILIGVSGLSIRGICLSADGTKIYIADEGNQKIHQVALSTAWDISTIAASVTYSLDVSSDITTLSGLCISSDGSYIYAADSNDNVVHRYDMSTDYSLSTATKGGGEINTSSQISSGNIGELAVSTDGSALIALDVSTATVYSYRMSVEYSLNSATFVGTSSTFFEKRRIFRLDGFEDIDILDATIAFSENGKYLYTYSSYDYSSEDGEVGPTEKIMQFPSSLIRST